MGYKLQQTGWWVTRSNADVGGWGWGGKKKKWKENFNFSSF
jgi:hypothetical protein